MHFDECHLNSHGPHMGDRFFLQKQFCGLHPAVRMKPALNNVVTEKISQRQQAHSLVMNHPRPDQLATTSPKGPPRASIVGCFIEAIGSEPSERIHTVQISQRGLAINS